VLVLITDDGTFRSLSLIVTSQSKEMANFDFQRLYVRKTRFFIGRMLGVSGNRVGACNESQPLFVYSLESK